MVYGVSVVLPAGSLPSPDGGVSERFWRFCDPGVPRPPYCAAKLDLLFDEGFNVARFLAAAVCVLVESSSNFLYS